MSTRPAAEPRAVWAFWVACALVAVGGAVPGLLAGTSGRISAVIIPFWVAAIALGACGLLQHRGRGAVTVLYFVAGLAVVYGILAMLAVPLRLAVIGTCPPPPAHCAAGFEPSMTEAESTGFGFAIGMGVVGILVGFFGLVVIYRRARRLNAPPAATTPPVRRIPPVRTKPAEPAAPAVQPAAPAVEPAPPAVEPAPTPAEAESLPELPAPEEKLELPAPEAELELPAHVADEAPETEEAPAPPSVE